MSNLENYVSAGICCVLNRKDAPKWMRSQECTKDVFEQNIADIGATDEEYSSLDDCLAQISDPIFVSVLASIEFYEKSPHIEFVKMEYVSKLNVWLFGENGHEEIVPFCMTSFDVD